MPFTRFRRSPYLRASCLPAWTRRRGGGPVCGSPATARPPPAPPAAPNADRFDEPAGRGDLRRPETLQQVPRASGGAVRQARLLVSPAAGSCAPNPLPPARPARLATAPRRSPLHTRDGPTGLAAEEVEAADQPHGPRLPHAATIRPPGPRRRRCGSRRGADRRACCSRCCPPPPPPLRIVPHCTTPPLPPSVRCSAPPSALRQRQSTPPTHTHPPPTHPPARPPARRWPSVRRTTCAR